MTDRMKAKTASRAADLQGLPHIWQLLLPFSAAGQGAGGGKKKKKSRIRLKLSCKDPVSSKLQAVFVSSKAKHFKFSISKNEGVTTHCERED